VCAAVRTTTNTEDIPYVPIGIYIHGVLYIYIYIYTYYNVYNKGTRIMFVYYTDTH